jgi:amidase
MQFDGLGLADLVHRSQVTPAELMACAVELARERAPALNALCFEAFDESLALAARISPKGVFGALPFLLKDSGLPATRFPSSIGSRLFGDFRFKFDATLVQRFEKAGLVPFARTTVPEFCMAPTTEALQNNGPTRNPWDLARSAGGSSGGAAAAVAVGIVPIAHANDGGGSIRIPASCCGVFGLKPSRGLVPMGPARGEGWGGLAVEGVVSRSVRDSAAALDAVAGYEVGAPYAAPGAARPFLAGLNEPFNKPLRVLKWRSTFKHLPIATECAEAVDVAAELLAGLGHEIVDTEPPDLDFDAFVDAHIDVLIASIVVTVDALVKSKPVEQWRSQLEPALLDGYMQGKSLAAASYVRAINQFQAIGRRMGRHMQGYDLVLTPTLTQLPVHLGEFSTQGDFRTFRKKVSTYTANLAVINASGQPAASLPLHRTEAGLPIGVQLIGSFGQDDTVLRASAQLEGVAPWSERRPPRPG